MSDEPFMFGQSLEALLGDLLQPEIPAAEIEAQAEASIKKAVAYFEDQGIVLGYIPSVKYTGEYCRLNKDFGAAVNQDIEFFKTITALVGATLGKTLFDKVYGLKLSEEALAESVEVGIREFGEWFPDGSLGHDADIFLFKPIQSLMHRMDEFMVHEVWHLIEKKYGVLESGCLIAEGTATYVENRFAGRKSNWIGHQADFVETVYHNSAHLVQEELGNKPNPLQAILNPEKRKAIQARFDERILPFFYDKAVETMKSGSDVDFLRHIVLNHAAYEAFRLDPTRENLLEAQRIRGYVKLADEFSRQDMTKAVKYYSELLK